MASHEAFDRITRVAAALLAAPAALLTIETGERSVVRGVTGLDGAWSAGTEFLTADCLPCRLLARGAAQTPGAVDDLRRHPEFAKDPLVLGGELVAWTGVRLRTAVGMPLGTLSVFARVPRRWTLDDLERLADLATLAESEIARQTGLVERRALEREVRLRQEQLDSLFANAPAGLAIVDRDLRYVQVNPTFAELNGSSVAEHLGRTVGEVAPEFASQVEPVYQRVLATGATITNLELTRDLEEGKSRAWTCSFFPISASEPKPVGVGAVFVDMTDRKSLEWQLRQAHKMQAIGRLAAGVAHDFNNLLTAIISYSDLIAQTLPDGDPMREDIEQIRRAGDRGAELTRQLLAFARQQVLQPQIVDCTAAVAQLERLLGRLIGEQIELSVQFPDHPACVRVDPSQFDQVLVNLVVNGRDAMPTGGRIEVEVRTVTLDDGLELDVSIPPGRYVELVVRDTGHGMDDATRRRVFEPFFTTKESGRGTGLGLATVYGVVKQSGGFIFVASDLGIGSTFTVYLPRIDADPTTRAARLPVAVSAGHETVLVVEDDNLVRDLTRDVLMRHGYRVLVAADGTEARRLLRSHPEPIDVLVTDVVLADTDGRAVARDALAARRRIKVLYVSGYSDEAVARHGVLDAESEFLPKPFTPEEFLQRIRWLLQQR